MLLSVSSSDLLLKLLQLQYSERVPDFLHFQRWFFYKNQGRSRA
jgi:hypothetical protein